MTTPRLLARLSTLNRSSIQLRFYSDKPNKPKMPLSTEEALKSGQMTPGTIAKQLSQLDLPAPSNLQLNDGPKSANSVLSNDSTDLSERLSHLNLPEPEALSRANAHRRSESQSQDLAEKLSKMQLPQPERIYGPDDTQAANKKGVSAEDWAKVKLEDEVPEAVRSPTDPRFQRNVQSPPPKAAAGASSSTPAAASGTSTPKSAGGAAKEQKITPFDVQGGVDADGKEIGM